MMAPISVSPAASARNLWISFQNSSIPGLAVKKIIKMKV
jgi:hypothetical protein